MTTAVACGLQWRLQQRQPRRTETAESGLKQRLRTTRMAAVLWIMGASVEAARRMQRLRQQAVNQNCVLRQALSTDVSWQLAKDADGPDGKMKNTRKFGFSDHELRTRNR